MRTCLRLALSHRKYSHLPASNAKGVAEVITLSRSFVSSTAKAKTAKLSTSHFILPMSQLIGVYSSNVARLLQHHLE